MTPEQQAAAQQLERDIKLYQEARRIAGGGSGVVSRAHVVSLLRALDIAQSLNTDLSVAFVALLSLQGTPAMLISSPAVADAARSGCVAHAQRQPDGSMVVRREVVRPPVVRDPGSVM